MRIRKGQDNKKLTNETTQSMYKAYLGLKDPTLQRYKGDFSSLMVEVFLPLLKCISGNKEAEFYQHEELERLYVGRVLIDMGSSSK